ncbi:hypothetical protein PF010_g29265 [Phytophthora fragariae]|uniref:Integrase catalytic domain-containing protein n=1 Tax=Phytophthora fragariae TaxID=53985 RepID=A0A6G0JNL5_9STRA|nr:hypothetical protein PF010_g29265 [Phytophthora fragariae]
MFSFITEDGVFTPNRMPQGATDSALHFQGEMQKVLAPLIPHSALVWVDDVILFAPTVEEFVRVLGQFFSLGAGARLKLNMAKSKLFEVKVLWCGRIISSAGVRHDPARVDALSTLPLPATVADLQYFVCASNWLQDSLPDYARKIAPLQAKLGAEKMRVGGRGRNALAVATVWTEPEQAAYEDVLSLVRASALMASPDPDAELLVFTDASLNGYSIVVTQVVDWDPTLLVTKQRHEMIICKGGTFKKNELNWTIVEKEAYPIVKACHDLEYLLLRPKGFRLYCDHANLVYIFAPHDALKKHVRDRLQRWAMRLCGLHYVIEHIAGEDNLWMDIVSRWHTREAVNVAAVQTRSRRTVPVTALSQLRPLSDEQFVFPTVDEIREAQQAAGRERSRLRVTLEEEGGVAMVDGRPRIPNAATDLLARLFVVAHTGLHGHRGQEPMVSVLQQRFFIGHLHAKVSKFVSGCLLCKHVKGPHIISRPYGPTLTAQRRNEALHWDFLFLGNGYGETAYLLVAKDALTHYCELFPCSVPTSFVAAETLSMWCARYGIPEMLMSDQGAHFRNEVVKHLRARLKVEQVFSPVYTPWLNGTVERLNKDVLQVVRALLMEYALDTHEWPYLLPALQANLNHTPVQSLGGHSPVELFTGLPASSPLDTVVSHRADADPLLVVDFACVGEQLESLRNSLHEMHKEVLDTKERKRLQDMATHKGSVVNFDVGDFVLWSRIDQRLPNNKLLGQWVGPFKVIEAKPHSFVIQHLISGREYDVHVSRLKFYADAELNQTEELLELVSSQGMMLGVEAICDHLFNHTLERWELLVSWMGLQAIENSWEPLTTLLQDVPSKVREYAIACEDDDLLQQVE